MTDINTRGKLPFAVVSSSVTTGYAAELTSSVGYNINIVNHHKDEYGQLEGITLQSPFTNQHVGGNQYRHIKLNDGTDNTDNRPEGYIISASAGSVKIYGPDVKGVHKPRSLLTRDTTSKSPINIKNIQTSGNIAGNFEHNYQVVQSIGRRTTNNLIIDGFEANGVLTTQFINNINLIVEDNLSSYSNGNKLTSNQYFLGDGTSEVRTETSTSDKYFVLNRAGSNTERFLRSIFKFKGKTVISYKAIVNRDNAANYDLSGLNLQRPEANENLLLQYSYDLINWQTFKTILTGSNASVATTETISSTDFIDLLGSYYLRFFQGQHSGLGTDNYGVTNIKIVASENDYSLPDIIRIDAEGRQYKDKTTFVERFNAPGGKEESSRGSLDREGEEYSPNNSLITRNIKVRQPYYNQLTKHSVKPFLSKLNSLDTSLVFGDLSLSMTFGNSGLSLYTTVANITFQFKLTKKYDLSTAKYYGSLSYPPAHGAGIAFNNTGNILYQAGTLGVIKLYNLTIPWDITTATYISDLTGFATSISGITFANEGNKFFTISSSTNLVECFTLSTAWTVNSSDPKTTFILTNDIQISTGIALNKDGTRAYFSDRYNGLIYEYSLSTPYDISTASFNKKHFLGNKEAENFDIFLDQEQNDYLFILDRTNKRVDCYINFINTYTTIENVNKNSINKLKQASGYHGESYVTSSRSDNFWVQHAIPATDLRYKWIADSMTSSQQPIEYQSYQGEYSRDGAFSDIQFEQKGPFGDHLGISGAVDKEEMWVSTNTNTMYRDRKYLNFTSSNDFYVDASNISSEITERDFTISFWIKTSENIPSFAIENSVFEKTESVASEDTSPQGIFFHPSGTFVYVVGATNDSLYSYPLTTPWDISTKGSPTTKSITTETTVPRGFYFKPDGTKLYVLSTNPNVEIIEYTLSTAWNISTAGSPVAYPFSNDTTPRDIFFKPDGTQVYIPGNTGDKIYQKTLSIAWDLTSTGSATTLSVPGTTAIQDLSLSEDGKHLYLIDSGLRNIYYYYLEQAWDITTATLLSSNTLSISSYETAPTGLFVNERQKKLYFVGSTGKNINQFDLVEQSLTLMQYSGSTSDNKLLLNVNFSSSYLTVSGSGILNSNLALPKIEDGNWHFITLTSDFTSTPIRYRGQDFPIAEPTTKTKIYVDGGLVGEAEQLYKKLYISKLLFSAGRDKEKENGQLDEIMIWNNTVLTEEQINEIYRISKPEYGQQPKKYAEHKLNNIIVSSPIHVYSSRTDDVASIMFDEVGNRNATLVNYTSSVNLQPQNSGIISYSTYFNGPYQGASWKSIRNAEHPVTRKLTTENTNIVSILQPEGPHDVYRTQRGQQVRFTLPGSRKQGTILNIKESPVYINNKPLKHKFILKDSADRNVGFELTHTYGNNLQYFANKELNDTLGLGKKERQIYDTLFDYYNRTVDENENPIERLVGYTYSETIFPKPGQALLKDVRQRTDYITDEPGYGLDGYDRQLGTQRVFWRDNQEDRMRTPNSYINSLGNQVSSYYTDLPALTPSVAALEFISESKNVQYLLENETSPPYTYTYEEIIETNYQNCGELNSCHLTIKTRYARDPFDVHSYYYYLMPSSQNIELFFFKNDNTTRLEQNATALNSINNNLYTNIDIKNPSFFRITPKFVYEHPVYILKSSLSSISQINTELYNKFTHDFGLNRIAEKESGKNPWYDSYQHYYIDVKNLSNDYLGTYSKLSEFTISDNVKNVIQEYGGDFTKVILSDYIDNISFNYKDSVKQDNEQLSFENVIKIKVNGIKKLLPYNGFYPQDRSLQLVNYLKESYLDTNAIKGGVLTVGYLDPVNDFKLFYDDENDKLAKQSKISSFLEPFYSPGIFYNLIKSGIAVSWNVYTGSFPIGNNESQEFFNTINKPPDFKIDFESLLDLKQIPFSSSNLSSDNRIIQTKEINFQQFDEDYEDYGFSSFQPFFERTGKGSNLYSFAINNFLAETINFFLKDSKLNSFISKPDTDFNFDSNKTYYMDVVLRKKNIIMCEAHSSSLAYNFGKMSGRYFGPAFWTGSNGDFTRIRNSGLFSETLRDPTYCAYTPPYFYGDSIARLSFKPQTSGRYTLDEIFNNLDIENINTGFLDDTIYPSGSLYSTFVMPVGSSITLKGQIEERQQTVELAVSNAVQNNLSNLRNNENNLLGTATNISGIKRWAISPKMEVPVLDFSNQEFITSTNILTQSYTDEQIKLLSPSHTPPTASGFGRGMWSGYGEIPTGDKGIFVELRESYPRELIGRYNPVTQTFTETNTGSLLQVCGFDQANDQLSKKVGELADSREISEAIIIIPYSDNVRTPQISTIDEDHFLSVNDTVKIEGHNFFKIEEGMFNTQLGNILSGKSALINGNYGLGGEIKETSISKMIKNMQKYVLPPNFDFLINRNIKPFVMYIAEFTSTLDKQDLADVWQGLMPKIATRAEREEQIISHPNSLYDFFHGKGLPKDVKFMIFKAKKRAQINYYKMTADSTDDGLFPEIQVGKGPSPYSFNWPYDYCSLVETAKVDIEIEYMSGSNNI